MKEFVEWFNDESKEDPPYVRAAAAHMRFVTIHPFIDGNGRIARALTEKALSQAMGRPSLAGISRAILEEQREYYNELRYQQQADDVNDVSYWIHWMVGRMIRGMDHSCRQVVFTKEREAFLNRIDNEFSNRQCHVLKTLAQKRGARVFNPKVSVKRYASIGGCLASQAVEDMEALASAGILRKGNNGSMRMVAFEHLREEEPKVPMLNPERMKSLRKGRRR